MEQDTQFFQLIFLLFIVICVAKIINTLFSENTPAVKKECKPHEWSYHPKTEKLTCCNCGFEAGTYITEMENTNVKP